MEPGEGVRLKINNATITTDGLMSSEDKQKLDGIDLGDLANLKFVSGTLSKGSTSAQINADGITFPVSVIAMSGDIPVMIDWSVTQGSYLNVEISEAYTSTIKVYVLYM